MRVINKFGIKNNLNKKTEKAKQIYIFVLQKTIHKNENIVRKLNSFR